MAEFNQAVLTKKGTVLLAKAQAENRAISITRAVVGSGTYENGEDLASMTELKSQKQEFTLNAVKRKNDTNVSVQFTITNFDGTAGLAHGYYVSEIGLMADDPEEGEILYSLATANTADFLQAYNNQFPATIEVEFLIEVANADNVTITTDPQGYATKEELDAINTALSADMLAIKSNIENAYNQANNAYNRANTAYNQANNAYNRANTAYNQANNAYNAANNAINRLDGNTIWIGSSATAAASGAIALGYSANASGSNSTALGHAARASNTNSTALGYSANASGYNSTALGSCANASSYSTALGYSANASGISSTALGYSANASGISSTALGYSADASGLNSTALGYSAKASGLNSTALGYSAKAIGVNSTALGRGAIANNDDSTALGNFASAIGVSSTALGTNTYASTSSTALGCNARADTGNSTALGRGANASGLNSTALGHAARASSYDSTALGSCANASGNNSTALGYYATVASTRNNAIQLGSASYLSELSCRVALTVTSDERDKADVTEIDNGAVEFLKKVKAIRYVFNHRELYIDEESLSEEERKKKEMYGLCEYDREAHAKGTKKGSRVRVGVSAQGTLKALREAYGSSSYANLINDNLFDLNPDDIPEGVENQLTANYEGFIPFLIKAVQELAARLEAVEESSRKGAITA